MKWLSVAAASTAVVAFCGAGNMGGAFAADLDAMPTKAPVAAPSGRTTCTNVADFFTTACQLAWYGVRFYGTIDVGYGYQTHGAPFDKLAGWGVNYLLGKPNRSGMWLLSPNALGPSNVGVQIKEPVGGGWSFIGQLQTNFDPYSLQLSDNPGSLRENSGVPTALQTSNGDASSNGKFYNGLGYAGVSNNTWGTLTVGRQLTLGADGVLAYDPMGSAPGFSVIGFSGAVAGGGDTEDKLATTAAKYRVNFGNFHFGAFYQFGGFDQGNASQGQFQGDVGGDFHVGSGLLSVDAVGGYTRDAVLLVLAGSQTNPFIKATLSDNTNVMLLAKYTLDKLQLFAGYEYIDFAPPSDPTITSFTDISGDVIGVGGIAGSKVSTTDFNGPGAKDKIQQMAWVGAKYSLTDTLTLALAYYRYDQNQYNSNCTNSNTALAPTCAGSLNAASVLLDWQFAPKWETYIGTFYSEMNGGIGAGNLAHNNIATTGGMRFRW